MSFKIKSFTLFLVVSLMLFSVGLIFRLNTPLPALAQSFSNCPQVLMNYGNNSQLSLDINLDGKVNVLDCFGGGNSNIPEIKLSHLDGSLNSDGMENAARGEIILRLKTISSDEYELDDIKLLAGAETIYRFATLSMADLNFVGLVFTEKTHERTLNAYYALYRNSLQNDSNIVAGSIEPNWIARTSITSPDDPLFKEGYQWNLNAINALKAWETIDNLSTIPAKKPVLGIIDTGIDELHEDLVKNTDGNFEEVNGINGVDDDNNGLVDDIYGARVTDAWGQIESGSGYRPECVSAVAKSGHGTLVNGLVAAAVNNSKGLAGAGYNLKTLNFNAQKPNCDIDDNIPTIFVNAMISGLDYLSSKDVKVTNLSMSIDCPEYFGIVNKSYCLFRFKNLEKTICKYTHDNEECSGPVVRLLTTVAGNLPVNVDDLGVLPCSYSNPGIICVTGTIGPPIQAEGFYPRFGYGIEGVDLAAPGVNPATTLITEQNPNDPYYYYKPSEGNLLAGTSFSAPQVGMSAVMIQLVDPDLSMGQIRDIIFATVDTKDHVRSFGYDHYDESDSYSQKFVLEDKVKTGGRLNLGIAVACAVDQMLTCLDPLKGEDWGKEVIGAYKIHGNNQVRGASVRMVDSESGREVESYEEIEDKVLGLSTAPSLSFNGLDNHPDIFAGIADSGVQIDHPDLKQNLHGNWYEYQRHVLGNTSYPADANDVKKDIYGVSVALNDDGTLKSPWFKTKPNMDEEAMEPWYLRNQEGDPICENNTLNYWDDWVTYRGTGINGIIGARGDNGVGLTGVAQKARLLNVNIFDVNSDGDCVTSPDAMVKALDYFAQLKTPVAQLSSHIACNGSVNCQPDVDKLEAAMCRFTHGNNNCDGEPKALLVVPAPDLDLQLLAGYDTYDIDDGIFNTLNMKFYPCQSENPGVICVASSRLHQPDSDFKIERFEPDTSFWGSVSVDLTAPGHRVLTTTVTGTGNLSELSDPGKEYAFRTGTPYASAYVTGTLLLMMEAGMANGQPALTAGELKQILLSTVDTKDQIASFGKDYWINSSPDQLTILVCDPKEKCAIEGKVVSNGRLNTYYAVTCAYTRECLNRDNQVILPVGFKDVKAQVNTSEKPVVIMYQPGIAGINGYPTDPKLGIDEIIAHVHSVLTQRGYKGINNGPITISNILREYRTYILEQYTDLEHDFCHYLGSKLVGNFIKCTRKQVADIIRTNLNQGRIVLSIGLSAGGSMNSIVANRFPELKMNPDMFWITLGSPLIHDDEVETAYSQSLAFNEGRFFYYEHPGDQIAHIKPWTANKANILIQGAKNLGSIENSIPAHNYMWNDNLAKNIDWSELRNTLTLWLDRHFPDKGGGGGTPPTPTPTLAPQPTPDDIQQQIAARQELIDQLGVAQRNSWTSKIKILTTYHDGKDYQVLVPRKRGLAKGTVTYNDLAGAGMFISEQAAVDLLNSLSPGSEPQPDPPVSGTRWVNGYILQKIVGDEVDARVLGFTSSLAQATYEVKASLIVDYKRTMTLEIDQELTAEWPILRNSVQGYFVNSTMPEGWLNEPEVLRNALQLTDLSVPDYSVPALYNRVSMKNNIASLTHSVVSAKTVTVPATLIQSLVDSNHLEFLDVNTTRLSKPIVAVDKNWIEAVIRPVFEQDPSKEEILIENLTFGDTAKVSISNSILD